MLLGSMFIIVSSLVLMTDKENENKFFKYLLGLVEHGSSSGIFFL